MTAYEVHNYQPKMHSVIIVVKCVYVGFYLQFENDAVPEEETKEESDEEDEEDEESGRIRFKSERTDIAVVRLADAGSKRRNIPETLGKSLEYPFLY